MHEKTYTITSLCTNSTLTDWYGDSGNVVLLVYFSSILLINIHLAVLNILFGWIRQRLDSHLLAQYLSGNVISMASEILAALMRLYYPGKCIFVIFAHVFKNLGMLTSATSLLILTFYHYLLILKE